MKFRGHETFFIRRGWLTKGMRNVAKNNLVFIDKERDPVDVLGIGRNMVKALRYWLQAVGLTYEEKGRVRLQKFTDIGKIIFEQDRYLEEIGTLQLLHYQLVTNLELATSWFYFFNEFSMQEFTREDFVSSIQKFLSLDNENKTVATRSLEDDFNCIVNTYIPHEILSSKKLSPEDNIDCPFSDLELIDIANKKEGTYRKRIPATEDFNPWIALAIILKQAENNRELRLYQLQKERNSISKVFNLDSSSLLEILRKVENLGEIKLIRTAGLDVIRINSTKTYEECILEYYKSLNYGSS